ncbi:TetM/TetW/TetO/TetS family tetracycline resistance ribosomal protection protein [uncultured Subdoligranulum sp.]|uniref:translation factor GTPase family protein n=1 Tax=uncultured Subdoligranulum sp. TaxID=512298 RepID=UPI002637E3A8|nr:TetM/TetW/TetO/TetS family tetracycline resistance ribosomal protection protein [uncultured Subdoligranulum sp.]
MKRLVVGLLAHVDSGKTTLAEGLLYRAGVLRKLGRVDHRDAFLDTDAQERARGITIFAKQAVLALPAADGAEETELTLLDTPGHVDFSAEAERALQVLDYAVLVISGTDGVQAHTETLWKLLARYRVPTLVFVNKMDLPGADAAVRLRELRGRFGDGCVDFTTTPDSEALALCSEPLMEEVLAEGTPHPDTVVTAIARRQVFPCFFGAALRLEGLDRLLQALQTLTRMPPVWPEFGARVFKISQDDAGTRLSWLKVTGGELPVKAVLPGGEKADALRLYNGSKFRLVSTALPGMVVAVAGPAATRPGQGLGAEADAEAPLLEPVLNYRADCADADPHTLLRALRTLEDEDPQLHVAWRDDLAEVHVQLMGEVQLEILQTLLQSRFELKVTFQEGGILYKETITAAVEGIGHYEPLRHYAEVHLLLESGPRGSGVQLAADCPPDTLAENWQRLVLTHLAERTHPGVLIGAPLTDVQITLVAGRAHLKHTEGGDFRQATYRAVRQGLRMAQRQNAVQLLEPWYAFTLEVPAEAIGRAMADIQRMCGSFDPPETLGDTARLTGRLPVATARGYAREIAAYTHGLGRWSVLPAGYEACHNAEEVMTAAAYDADGDLENPADSVFCSHGAGYVVKWDEVPAKAHVDSGLARRLAPAGQPTDEEADAGARRRRADAYRGTLEQDKELLAIFERTYGKIKHRGENGTDAKKAARAALHTTPASTQAPAKPQPTGPDYLLVDGYNVIFAWDDLRRIAESNLDAARRRLMDILCNYAGYKRCVPILVFDAYKVRGGVREVEKFHNLYVVYTKEAETADMYIERATHELAKERRTRVVSSDGAEQVIVLGHGALRVSARAFAEEVAAVEKEIREFLQE